VGVLAIARTPRHARGQGAARPEEARRRRPSSRRDRHRPSKQRWLRRRRRVWAKALAASWPRVAWLSEPRRPRSSARIGLVVGGVDDDAHVGEVLRHGCGPWSARRRRSSSIEGSRAEGIEVAGHEVDAARCRWPRGRRGARGFERSARMPPWIFGWRVLTRPPSISGLPVIVATSAADAASTGPPRCSPDATSSTAEGVRGPGPKLEQAGLVVDAEQLS
jgi:hypothetical protein